MHVIIPSQNSVCLRVVIATPLWGRRAKGGDFTYSKRIASRNFFPNHIPPVQNQVPSFHFAQNFLEKIWYTRSKGGNFCHFRTI